MASENGRSSLTLEQELLAGPHRFGFFQAVRLLRLLGVQTEGYVPPGSRDRLFFRTPLSLDFPAGEIDSLDRIEEGGEVQGATFQMTVNFMGLTGPSGVLPWHYTESLIAAKARYRNPPDAESLSWSAPHDFFDIFSHRIISLFEQAWEKYNFWVRYERGERDYLSSNLLSFAGLGTGGLQNRLSGSAERGVGDQSLVYYAGLLSRRPVSGSALAAVLSGYFGLPARAEEFFGRWLNLPEEQRTALGETNSVLGEDATIGDRAWDRQNKFRVVLGPMTQERLMRLLPNGDQYEALRNLVRFMAGIGLDFDVQLVLSKEEVPPCILATPEEGGQRLGWSAWLKYRKDEVAERDSGDVVLAM